MKVAVLFGGKSSEHEISLKSGISVIEHLNRDKYEIVPIFISRTGEFYMYSTNTKIDNIISTLCEVDVVFPVLHGKYGEDGTIQGLLDIINKPYVGCGVLASALCMDKVYTKIILESNGIETAKYVVVDKKDGYDIDFDKKISSLLYPVFVKPSRSGSSIGVHKCNNIGEVLSSLEDAFLYDDKILIEECIVGRELEVAIMGNDELIASNPGEIINSDNFYSFDSKYNSSVINTRIPTDLDKLVASEIIKTAKKAYKACGCTGLSRVDFFLEKSSNKIVLNEINTMPGFTDISMFPILMMDKGFTYSEILDKLIELAFNNFR